MPKISFILPAYKRRFLREAIASILAQTYRDFELVVVDDCSPEDLKSVVDEFHDERLTYHRNETNIGGKDLVTAWNHALEFAKGEWVICAGDDDVYEPNFLAEMLALSARHSNVDALHCRLIFIDSEGNITGLGKPRAEIENLIEVIYHSSVDRLDQRIPEFMYRRSVLLKHGGYAPSPRAWYSDIKTSIMMAQEHGSAFANKFLLRWRLSNENISGRHDDVADKIEATIQFLEWLPTIINKQSYHTTDDRLMLNEIFKYVEDIALQSVYWYWSQVPFRSALRILSESRLSPSTISSWRKRRFCSEIGPIGVYKKIRNVFFRHG